MSTVFYDWVLDHPLVGSSLEKNRFSLWAASVACNASSMGRSLWNFSHLHIGISVGYHMQVSLATIFLRSHGYSFTVMPKRQYPAVGLLVTFCPLFHDSSWDLDVAVMLGSISWACGGLSFSICWLAVGLYNSLWLLQKKKFLCLWVKVTPICGYKDKYLEYN